MTVRDAVVRVLKEAQGPLHYSVITERAMQNQYWLSDSKTPAATVNHCLTFEIREQGDACPFVAFGRGVYGLRGRDAEASWEGLRPRLAASERAVRQRQATDQNTQALQHPPVKDLKEIRGRVALMDEPPTSLHLSSLIGTVYVRIQDHELCIAKLSDSSWEAVCLIDTLPGSSLPEKALWLQDHVDFEGALPYNGKPIGRVVIWRSLRRSEIRHPGKGDVLAWFGSVSEALPAGAALRSTPQGANWHKLMAAHMADEFRGIRAFLDGSYSGHDAQDRLPFWIELCYRAHQHDLVSELSARWAPTAEQTVEKRIQRILRAVGALSRE